MQFNCGTPLKTMLFCWGPYGILAYYAAVENATLVSPKLRMVRKSCLKQSRHPKKIGCSSQQPLTFLYYVFCRTQTILQSLVLCIQWKSVCSKTTLDNFYFILFCVPQKKVKSHTSNKNTLPFSHNVLMKLIHDISNSCTNLLLDPYIWTLTQFS